MQKTRAAFKLSLRYCRQHEEVILADKLATNLMDKQFNKFWQNVRKQSNAKVAAKVNTVAGCVGDYEISDMWKKHILIFFITQLMMMGQSRHSCNVCQSSTNNMADM